MTDFSPEFTFLMPCLNEAETLGTCIKKCMQSIERLGLEAEVVIADNGSTDGSQDIAESLGARVVPVPLKGYGSALMGGIREARGTYVLMADADDSYDWGAVDSFVEQLRAGHDLVMGCRLPKGGGTIVPGAMPVLHRWLGNPVLTWLGKLFFRAPVNDFHCGLRGFSREKILSLDLRMPGMEFATEMVAKACLNKLSICEVPITLHPDGRNRAPHLRTWRDGWRHLRFMLLYSPMWLFMIPGLALGGLGLLVALFVLLEGMWGDGSAFHVNTMLVGLLGGFLGFQSLALGVFTKVFAITEGLLPSSPSFEKWIRLARLEVGLVISLVFSVLGLWMIGSAFAEWAALDFGSLSPAVAGFRVIPGVGLVVLGVQIMLNSFFLSVLGLRRG
ncbi:glycosyltransferase family 2 protein [Salidesulfovibrio onnuriiensis]|uniref:glycosyltransferase family 2 protein n=1 Tax=Salidesulfovibrio onnuriiensis TaxID=2583823 RepID=UPI0011C8521F|nr:glycosyltransferase family 2 protein [Salidesulfovibrio onnuriiensis]